MRTSQIVITQNLNNKPKMDT